MEGISALSSNSLGFGSDSFDKTKINQLQKVKNNYQNNLNRVSDEILKLEQTGKNYNEGNSKITEDTDKKRRFDSFECQTCKNRKYQDKSDDMGVSFQTPTKLSPDTAENAVKAHENQHVSRNQAKADREGDKVVSQSVTISRGICPECGKTYVAGGTTKTTTMSDYDKRSSPASKYNVGMFDGSHIMGKAMNTVA